MLAFLEVRLGTVVHNVALMAKHKLQVCTQQQQRLCNLVRWGWDTTTTAVSISVIQHAY